MGFPLETLIVFVVMCVGALWIDLKAHKDDHVVSLKEASLWSLFWVAVALAFGGYIYLRHGADMASLYVTGYALEKVLSVDNLFVIMAVFAWFKVPQQYQHRVLYWGIIGAIVFRLIFVAFGTALLALGPWVEIGFAALIAVTAIMMLKSGDDDEEADFSNHLAVRVTKKFFPVKESIDSHNFFERHSGKLMATPLFLCLAVVELSDVMFAFDSVPAVIAVSKEPLIVYSAMMFAILGLRTLYFVLAALKKYLVHLETAVVALLFFIAGKLALNSSAHIFHHDYTIEPTTSLVVVLVVLGLGVVASLLFPKKD